MNWGRRRSESSRGRCGPGPESAGSWPGSWHLLPWLLPLWAAGSSLEGDVPAPGPPGHAAALSSEPQACLSFPAPLSWGQCPDLISNQGQRDDHTTKMNFLQQPRPPGIPGHGMRDPCRGAAPLPTEHSVFTVEEGCRQGPFVTFYVI